MTRCGRCGGSRYTDIDELTHEAGHVCLQCGWRGELPANVVPLRKPDVKMARYRPDLLAAPRRGLGAVR